MRARRGLTLLLQLGGVALAVWTASVLALRFDLIPSSVLGGTKLTAFTAGELLSIGLVFTGYHLAAYLAALRWTAGAPFSSAPRALLELYWGLAATSLASCHMFLFSLVPFVPNYYAWMYVLTGALPLAGWLVAARLTPALDGSGLGSAALSRWTVLTCGVVLAPGVLAVGYKKVPRFADLVNYARVSLNMELDTRFTLQDAYPGLRLEQPMDVRFAGGAAYVLERPGRLVRVGPDGAPEVLLDISEEVGSTRVETGALSFALHPEFAREDSARRGLAFVYYTHWGPETLHNRLARFDLSLPTEAERRASRELLIDQRRPPTGYHNGGTVLFGPDGFLYLSVGEASFPEGRQQVDSHLLGGVLRLDVDCRGGEVSAPIAKQPVGGVTQGYFVPRDNPYVDRPGALGEFWAHGFRNPFRMSIDRLTGEVWLGDIGSNEWEEIDRIVAGQNGQYPYRQGPELDPVGGAPPAEPIGQEVAPLWAYRQTALDRAVIGGLVYRDEAYPRLRGRYVFADNQSGLLKALEPDDLAAGPRVLARTEQLGQQGITSVRTDPRGELYVTVLGAKGERSGRLLRLVEVEEAPGELASAAPRREPDAASVAAQFAMHCSRCHGLDGRGEPTSVPPGGTPRPDFTLASWQAGVSDAHLRRVVQEGGAAVGLSPEMPSWKGVFSERELELLLRHLRGFGHEQATVPRVPAAGSK